MRAPEELVKWVEALTASEKRFVKLLGKARAGKSESQQLELLDWINQSDAEAELPPDAGFTGNLPVVTGRLKDLILDSLRLLHKSKDTDALLRTEVDEASVLFGKKLNSAAQRHLRRSKKNATETGRYEYALQCIHLEQKIVRSAAAPDTTEKLKALREEEMLLITHLAEIQELRFRHDMVHARARQIFAPRDQAVMEEVKQLADAELVHRLGENGGYIEKALAVNILGLMNLLARDSASAVARYKNLLVEWRDRRDWQADQAPLLMHICRMYQNACYYTTMTQEELKENLELVPDFSMLPPDAARDYQRTLYLNQLALSLNTGNFEAVDQLIPVIDTWLKREEEHLIAGQLIALCYNMAVAEFLSGRFSSANRYVLRILNMPDKKSRGDIRDFARVLQAVLQFEMGNASLNEYLTRSGKRHFSKQAYEVQFEPTIFRYIENAMEVTSPDELKPVTDKLVSTLETLAESQPGDVPLLGLMEMRLWAKSKQTEKPLKDVFLETVRENLRKMK